MTPQRRTALLKLIARMDQEIAGLADTVRGTEDREQRRDAASLRRMLRKARRTIEKKLTTEVRE